MASEVLINAGAGEIRVARVVNGRLEDYRFERILGRDAAQGHVGDIILGRVQRVMPSMQAAFVEIGQSRAGFLALREARSLAREGNDNVGISDCVREGEAILTQVIKDPIGEKGARLSASISLPGRLAVMTPGQPGLAVSRQIVGGDRRAAIMAHGRHLLEDKRLAGAGFIFRSAAESAAPEDVTLDALALGEIWRGIDEKRKTARPPALLHRDLGPIERALRDMVRGDTARVLIDNAGAAETARAYCRRFLPDAQDKIEYVNEPVFERYDLEDEIARLSEPRVILPSGAWITIEATEALTAIDVNSGSYAASSALEETGFAVNLEAAREISRQLRLRGIGGLIVADFIQMTSPEHRASILATLAKSLEADRTPTQISAMSEFGIVAIARKRVRESLPRLMSETCSTCSGIGQVATAETVGQKILRRIEREAQAWPGRELAVTAAPSVAGWLNENGAAEALARRGVGRVRIEAGATMAREAFDVRPV